MLVVPGVGQTLAVHSGPADRDRPARWKGCAGENKNKRQVETFNLFKLFNPAQVLVRSEVSTAARRTVGAFIGACRAGTGNFMQMHRQAAACIRDQAAASVSASHGKTSRLRILANRDCLILGILEGISI